MSMNAKTFITRKYCHGSTFINCDIERNNCQPVEDKFIIAAAERDKSDG